MAIFILFCITFVLLELVQHQLDFGEHLPCDYLPRRVGDPEEQVCNLKGRESEAIVLLLEFAGFASYKFL